MQKLAAADADAFDAFGSSVGISGDTVVVGVFNDDTAVVDSGSAYVFVSVATVVEIPTLSEWSLALMVVLLAVAAIAFRRRNFRLFD